MELIVTILTALPLGLLIKSRTAAYIAFIAIHSFVFTFQSVELIINWVGGSKEAFGPYPKADKSQIWAYGIVNLVIFAGGLGLVTLGYYLANRRRNKSAALNLETGRG
jgi:ABC-type xylose transport system permease subunit